MVKKRNRKHEKYDTHVINTHVDTEQMCVVKNVI